MQELRKYFWYVDIEVDISFVAIDGVCRNAVFKINTYFDPCQPLMHVPCFVPISCIIFFLFRARHRVKVAFKKNLNKKVF